MKINVSYKLPNKQWKTGIMISMDEYGGPVIVTRRGKIITLDSGTDKCRVTDPEYLPNQNEQPLKPTNGAPEDDVDS